MPHSHGQSRGHSRGRILRPVAPSSQDQQNFSHAEGSEALPDRDISKVVRAAGDVSNGRMTRPAPVRRTRTSMVVMSAPTATIESEIQAALATVDDPEIRKPITELGMVRSVAVDAAGVAEIGILLTVVGCPLRDKLTTDITAAVSAVPGVTAVRVDFGVMTPEQRQSLQQSL